MARKITVDQLATLNDPGFDRPEPKYDARMRDEHQRLARQIRRLYEFALRGIDPTEERWTMPDGTLGPLLPKPRNPVEVASLAMAIEAAQKVKEKFDKRITYKNAQMRYRRHKGLAK